MSGGLGLEIPFGIFFILLFVTITIVLIVSTKPKLPSKNEIKKIFILGVITSFFLYIFWSLGFIKFFSHILMFGIPIIFILLFLYRWLSKEIKQSIQENGQNPKTGKHL